MFIGGFILIMFFMLIPLATVAVQIIATWKIFQKAGKEGWESIVPFYNMYILYEITWGNGLLFLLLFVPLGNLVITVATTFKLAKVFNQELGFGFGLLFLPVVFYPLLGFGDAEYTKPDATGKKGVIIGTIIAGGVWLLTIILVIILSIVLAFTFAATQGNSRNEVTVFDAIEQFDIEEDWFEEIFEEWEIFGDEEEWWMLEEEFEIDQELASSLRENPFDLSARPGFHIVQISNGRVILEVPIPEQGYHITNNGVGAFREEGEGHVYVELTNINLENDTLYDVLEEEVEFQIEMMRGSEFYNNVVLDSVLYENNGSLMRKITYEYHLFVDEVVRGYRIIRVDDYMGYVVITEIDAVDLFGDIEFTEWFDEIKEVYGINQF